MESFSKYLNNLAPKADNDMDNSFMDHSSEFGSSLVLHSFFKLDKISIVANEKLYRGSLFTNNREAFNVKLVLATNSGSLVKTNYSFAGWNTTAHLCEFKSTTVRFRSHKI